MAAERRQSTEVPASDVLCEAMEYLSKLGSNLRSRSESLKEKRISKGKLKNSHALQKAASKVLLICELSKKSLDNVETGVRKVLSLLDAAQLADAKNRQNKEYHYFEYKSRKLRIAKKIPLKHYMSVKVVARGMPTTMIDKYPVYYNCKLKLHRRRAAERQNAELETDNLSDVDVDKNKTNTDNLDKANKHLDRLGDINDPGTEDIADENMSESKNDAVNETEQVNKNLEDSVSKINDSKSIHKHKDNSDSENDSPSNSSKNVSYSDVEDSNKKEHNKNSKRSSKDDKSHSVMSLHASKKNQRLRFADVYSSDNESQKSTLPCETDTKCSDDDDINNSKNNNFKNEPKAKKIKLEPGSESKTKLDSEEAVKSDSDNDSTRSNNNQSRNGSGSETTRPMIRCVNLSKLLKPNINTEKSPKKLHKKDKKSNKDDDRSERKKKKKEEYWAQKRKEVSEFKPKKFSVNIERLPSLSVKFLLAHNLKKIIKKGDVICELSNEIDTPILKKKIKAVKNALLNDSESDDNIEMSKTKKLKKALLTDSDSNHSSSKKECCKESNQSDNIHQKSNTTDSDSAKNEEHVESNIASSDVEKNDAQIKTTQKTNSLDTNSERKDEQVETVDGQSDSENNDKQVKTADQQTNKTDTDSGNNDEQVDTENNVSEMAHDKSELPTEVSREDTDEHQNESNDSGNEKSNSQSKKDNSNNHSDMNTPETPTKSNQRVKSSLLKDSSDSNLEKTPKKTKKADSSSLNNSPKDGFAGFELNNEETPTKKIQKIKSSLLNNSSDEKSDQNNDKESPSKTIQKVKSSLLNNSSDEKSDKKDEQESPTKENQKIKSSLLNNSSDEKSDKKDEKESPTKENQKVKSSLLNNSSDEKCDKNKEVTPTKTNAQVKSALLNESSDVKSDASDDREKRKTPKYKRKHARRSREAKKKLKYSSSSDSEPEKNRHEKKDKSKPHMSSSSSSGEENIKKKFGQIDGTVDEHSNSSFDKMVRSKAKPSGSSSLNSDTQDASDKDIDGLTNLNNLSKNRRRDRREDRKHTRSHARPILGEDLLKPESSSDDSDDDDAGNDGELEEELPPVTLPGINGDGIEHMAKDDLLDSDSSVSQKDNSNAEGDSDDDATMKLKRRKANAISSDEEYGSKLKKERMSDFEDSDDDNSDTGKKSKRKKKLTDSDGSLDSTDEGKKKRRRIKPVNDSDLSGSDSENEGKNKHGRKNIRKVMGKNQLEEATKKAAREEKERMARIAERQKVYNNLAFDESGKPDEVVLDKVILDFDPETKEPLIQVDRGLVKKLKPHQANGIKFMWDACFESVKRIKKDKGSGCILAHCMGLGKTLQVISLTHTLLTHAALTGVSRVLVVCPLSTVLNWVNEVRMWLKHADSDYDVDVYELSRYKQNSERAFQLQQWLDGGGVCVLGYEMFRNLSADNNKKFKKKMLKSFQEALVDPGPDLVVCDEGHLLKNEKTSLSQSMNRVKTLRRIVLTGTPLQNNLKEYYCMVQFVKPNLLGKYNEYLNRFVNPITNGQYTDSTDHDIKIMKRRSHVLHTMLDGAVQRRDYGVLAPFLPPKHEYVLFITLTDVQIKLYQHYLDNYSRRPLPGKSSGFLFPDFQSLQRIWTHPLVLKYNSERYEIMQQKKRDKEEEDSEGSLVDFIDDDSTPDESSTDESSDDLSDMSDDSRKKSSKKKKAAKKSKAKETKASTRRGTRANPGADLDEDMPEEIEIKNENPTEWWIKLVEETELDDMRNSHKLVLLFDILRQCDAIGDKLLVFSQSLYSLDLIEHFLGKVDEATQDGRIDEKLGGHVGSWSPGVDYFRLDGSSSCENRSIWCKNFNREDNPRARLFLISTRAGGLGINLVAANRVVIFDVSWNPSHDVQSIFRVYRFGQKKPCYVYRFLAMGTMEEKIYERQVTKQAISKRVIDEQQIDRHYAENDLAELYKFEARPAEPRPLPTLPKDRLFAEMLKEHEAQIYKYHEHESMLENKEEETLSEEERKAAWEDFENEKNKPPPAPFPAWNMQNGMMPGLLAAQQQQLAYAALAAMLRKDMPNINDNQIRDMLPLIYNSNPQMFGGYDYGLMQKMSEIYKYAQPGMMNPGMMNPMNAGSGGGPNMGGTSGLQYEPPWQRQQQQQQQMRLQQLMQQQNQMGAKFYAGGLGSRDPVAMALQQQRAREIMMGGGAGRPRGRPPLQPRAASAASSDVVNLDSD